MENCNFKEFVAIARATVKEYLPDTEEWQKAEVIVRPIKKLSGDYTGLMVKRAGVNICANINLEAVYNNGAESIESAMKFIAMSAQMMPEGLTEDFFTSYENIKDRLFIRLSNMESGREIIDGAPHRMITEDIAMTAHVLVPETGDGSRGSTMVSNGLAESWGVTGEEILEQALANSERIMPANLLTMLEMMSRLMATEKNMEPEETRKMEEVLNDSTYPAMFVLTNSNSYFGAGAVLYPGVQECLRKKGNFFVIPSSVHETILIPDDGTTDADSEELEDILRMVNATEVAPADRLQDTLLYFDSEKGLITAEEHAAEANKNVKREATA